MTLHRRPSLHQPDSHEHQTHPLVSATALRKPSVTLHPRTLNLEKVAKLFSAMLKKNRTLRHLDLARNELTTQAGIALAGALRVNRSLAFLSLAGNAVGPKAGKALAQALSENSTLTGADLSDNTLGVATADGGDPNDVGLAFGIGLRRYGCVRRGQFDDNCIRASPDHTASGLVVNGFRPYDAGASRRM